MKLAVDVGGTFTDLVMYDETSGQMTIVKCPSTPDGFERGVLNAVEHVSQAISHDDISFIHGSTVVINHLLERKGARTALVTTKGFRDVLDIQRTNRPDLYNLRYEKPKAYVERADRFEIEERIGPDGSVLKPVNLHELDDVVERLRAGQYDAIAIAFINAYKNPAHEHQVRDVLRQRLPDVYTSCSSHIQLWREYERTNTVSCNAYVGPAVSSYLQKLEDGLAHYGVGTNRGQSPTMMLSNGGRTTFEEARLWPIDLVESGPSAGVTGACVMANQMGISDFIALDVGGTTAKAALVEAGRPQRLQEYTLEPGRHQAGYPLLVPTMDITEVGAGGGSIVRVTEDGAIRVGPDSAGANPGPACYGRGGQLPTITDANYLAGRLPDGLAQGMRLNRKLAEQAFAPLIGQLGIPLEDVVKGVLRVAESRMARVLQLATVARGKDPRSYHLIAYGGSAPLHAVEMARELRIESVIIPPSAGVFAAWGMVHAPYLIDMVKTVVILWPEGREHIAQEMAELCAAAKAKMIGMGRSAKTVDVFLDVRYAGQARSLSIPGHDLDQVYALFVQTHREKYGFGMDGPIEITGIHVVASDGDLGNSQMFAQRDSAGEPYRDGADDAPRPIGTRDVLVAGGWGTANIYRRSTLQQGDSFTGPAIVEEETTTTYVPPGSRLTVDARNNLVISLEG